MSRITFKNEKQNVYFVDFKKEQLYPLALSKGQIKFQCNGFSYKSEHFACIHTPLLEIT